MNICDGIKKLTKEENLRKEEIEEILGEIIEGKCTKTQIGGFLIGLKMKGETVEEILGVVQALRKRMIKINVENEFLIDTCGTGGDGLNTFNISTAASIVSASAGVKIAKHGNRSVSSMCGSADVLEKLNIRVDLSKEKSEKIIKENGMSFLFAPYYHGAMKSVAEERRELKTRTIFNLIGPLVNPANLSGQLLGIYDKSLMRTACEVLKSLGLKKAMIVHSEDGLDEISISDETNICELKDGEILEYKIKPEDFNIERASLENLKGNDAEFNAKLILEILEGKKGPKRDVVILNSGASIYIGNKANSLEEGVQIAREMLDSKKALEKYKELVYITNKEE
ncbi:MAG: anthranilate phosphoribosyltransferase [Clostridium sp.]|uniref:anthranilate phosphoribosyltransferase n=1 Tax=Clostridium sp. TaxID=1506 RepID=UPI003F3B0D44